MTKTLYTYQLETVKKLEKLRYGLEASEMGTGKTLVGIELIRRWMHTVAKNTGKVLPAIVITPINTFPSWEEKLKEQLPNLSVLVINRSDRKPFIDSIKTHSHDVYICHYESIRLMIDEIKDVHFSSIIADEVHKISNRNASVTKAVKKLQSYHKLGMSGTASGDKPWNLWSVLNWLDRRKYSSFWKYVDKYANETVASGYRKFIGVKNVEELHEDLSSFYVRHLRKERCCPHHPEGVNPWLPDKVYKTLYVELKGEQLRLYREMHKDMVAWLGEQKDTPLVASIALAKMQRLSQIALATPRLSEDGQIVELFPPSTKLDALMDIVQEYYDKQYIVYTTSKKMAELTAAAMFSNGVAVAMLTGDTPKSDREKLTKQFNDGKFRVIVAVIDAAAEGIDGWQLTCDTVVFLDRSWKTYANKQAEDRLYRIGQTNNVTIIDIEAVKTIDQYRRKRIENKWDMIMEVLKA